MRQKLLYPSRVTRLLACTSTLILALGLGSCQTSGLSDITGSIDEKADTGRAGDPRRDAELYQERYRANPRDADVALKYGKALRASGQRAQAVAVLEQGPSPIPATSCCSPPTAARWPTTAISSRPSMCSAAPIAPTIRIGGCSRRRERHWINSADTRRRGNIIRVR